MTIHVLHAGDGYLYLIRSVASHDAGLVAGESLAAYYTASGQPPGRWAGQAAASLGVAGEVTEAQMRSLFGEGAHPNAVALVVGLVADGMSGAEAEREVRLGRRFPQFGRRLELAGLARAAYAIAERDLGRPPSDDEKLEVRQRAAAEEFRRRTGREPLDPQELTALGYDQANREAVAGYDLVFTPVKSVATVWGIGSPATRDAIFEAHNVAVADALTWLEQNVALTRSGGRGEAQLDTLGVTAAVFDHWDSRAGDPDLHTHVAISNKVQGPDEKWRSLDGRPIFAAAVSLSERYNTRIEDELRSRIGVEFADRNLGGERRPVREIVGVPQELLDCFSKRRQGIEQHYQNLLADYRDTHDREPSPTARHQLYQQATLTERPEKQRGRSLEQMVGSWHQEAARVLHTNEVAVEIERLVHGSTTQLQPLAVDRIADRVLDQVAASRATWNVHHVRAEAHRQTRGFQTEDRDVLIEAVVNAATDSARAVRIDEPRGIEEPPELRRRNGDSVFTEHGSTLFTSWLILDAEARVVSAARLGSLHRASPYAVDACIAKLRETGRALNREQAAMVRAFCLSGRVVQLGLAPAGAGKTTAMRVVADSWRSSNRPIVALAPSAAAAGVLGEELDVEADTLAKFDHDQIPIAPGTMILIDEAGMAGTLMLSRVVDRAVSAGAVVRLIGDDQQLAAIEAGGVLRQIDHEVGSVRLRQVVRFVDPAEAEATLQVRDGDSEAIDFYLDRQRIVAGTDQTTPNAAYAAWLEDVGADRDALLLAASGRTVADLNARARADLVLAGKVAVDGVSLRDGNTAAVGDQVCTRRNARRMAVNGGRDWVKNGDGWRVLAVHDDGALTIEHRRHRGRVTLPDNYVRDHVELDYARTIRRAQGMTVDHAHLIVDPQLAREDLYVGLSRARYGTRLYVATMTDPRPDHQPEMAGATRAVLGAIIARSAAEPSAHEAIRAAAATALDLRRMAVEYEYALGVQVGDRYKTLAEAIHPGITADVAWPAVAHRLHIVEGFGLTAADALGRADRMRDFADARSETEVLAFRLDRILSGRPERPHLAVPAWLGPPPPSESAPPWDTYLPARYQQLTERLDALTAETEVDRPCWLSHIGGSTERTRAIRHVVAYRNVYAITDPDPVGPEPPPRGRQHDAWTSTQQAIRASHAGAVGEPPGASRLRDLMVADQPAAAYDTSTTRDGTGRHL